MDRTLLFTAASQFEIDAFLVRNNVVSAGLDEVRCVVELTYSMLTSLPEIEGAAKRFVPAGFTAPDDSLGRYTPDCMVSQTMWCEAAIVTGN